MFYGIGEAKFSKILSTISKFAGTTNESTVTKDSLVKSERAHYFDAGVTQKITEGFNVGIEKFSAHR